MIFRFFVPLFAALALSACATIPSSPAPAEPVHLRIIGLNDFHGNLEPIRRTLEVVDDAGQKQQVPVAGAAYLASAVAKYRTQDTDSMVIAAGDLIGASPLASSIFLDEPAIGVMNRLGLDFNAVGNHEFDRGWRELLRMQSGGCAKFTLREPCQVENPFPGANFRFLAANVVTSDGETLFPSYGIKHFGSGRSAISVGVIGLTTIETPTLVTPSGVDSLTFRDEADTVNALVPELKAKGVDVIVVSIHQGLYTGVGYNDHSCGGVSGTLLKILKRLDPRVDLVISGHTHIAYVCDYAAIDPDRPFLVTSAGYGGSFLTDIALTVDPAAGRVVVKSANNVIVQSDARDSDGKLLAINPAFEKFPADPAVKAYVQRYTDASKSAAERGVGRISGPAADPVVDTDETQLGNLIADAQLAGTRTAGAQIAFMNNSGIRTSINPASDGTVTYGDIYAVQPFGNLLITRSFTGSQLLALLEQQFDEAGFFQTFSASQGFAMSFDLRRPVGNRIVAASLDGQPIETDTVYRVTMNSFLAAGGDTFTKFLDGTDSVTGSVDLDAMEEYIRAMPVRALPALGRVTEIK